MEEKGRTIPEMMLDALDPVREVLESYRDSLRVKQHDKAMLHIKEALRALAGEKHSSKKAAYHAAVFVRKAFALRAEQTGIKASGGDLGAASQVLKELTQETWALRALGYGIDAFNPAFLEAKIHLPPLVKFENMTPAPEQKDEKFEKVRKEAQERGLA